MHKTIVAILLLVVVQPANAGNRLLGTWKSSLEMTKNFYIEHAILKSNQLEFIEQTFGELEVEYKKKSLVTRSNDKTIKINGKEFNLKGLNNEVPYQILFETDRKVVLKQKNLDGRWDTTTLIFENDDVYWEYVGENKYGSLLNIREYFVRVK